MSNANPVIKKSDGRFVIVDFDQWINLPSPLPFNVALNKEYTASATLDNRGYSLVDEDIDTTHYIAVSSDNAVYVEIDLGEVFSLNKIKVWHYYSDERTYHETKTEVSEDGINWIAVFDSAIDGEYAENAAGKEHVFEETNVRYIRDWLHGSTANTGNHWVELKAFSDMRIIDVAGFTLSGQERRYINGPLDTVEYVVETAEMYGTPPLWVVLQDNGTFGANTIVEDNMITLDTLGTEELIIEPTDDAYITAGSPDSNYSGNDFLNILGYTSQYWKRAFLDFDVPNREIVRAEFWAYYYANDISSREQEHRIKKITSPWNEGTVTWNTRPSFIGEGSLNSGERGRLQNVGGGGINHWRKATITSLAQEWVADPASNYGLVIDTTYNNSVNGGYWASIKYYSKEHVDKHPYLLLEASIVDPYSDTWTSDAISLTGDKVIKWEESKPANTDIKVEVAVVADVWSEVTNGEVVTSTGTFWVRVTLYSLGGGAIPTIYNLQLTDVEAPPDKIRLITPYSERFNNVENNLTVEYDAVLGNLRGYGGYVGSFSNNFIPLGLIQNLPTNAVENLNVTATFIPNFQMVTYVEPTYEENLKASATVVSVELLDVSVVNP